MTIKHHLNQKTNNDKNMQFIGVVMSFPHSTKQASQTAKNGVEQDFQEFSERFQLAIEQAGGTKKLAEQLGVSLSVLENWHSGKTEPSRSNLIKITQASQLSLHWLTSGLGRVDDHPEPWPKERGVDLDSLEEIILKIRRLFAQQELSARAHYQARIIRLAYEYYLQQGQHMDDDSVDSLIQEHVIQ